MDYKEMQAYLNKLKLEDQSRVSQTLTVSRFFKSLRKKPHETLEDRMFQAFWAILPLFGSAPLWGFQFLPSVYQEALNILTLPKEKVIAKLQTTGILDENLQVSVTFVKIRQQLGAHYGALVEEKARYFLTAADPYYVRKVAELKAILEKDSDVFSLSEVCEIYAISQRASLDQQQAVQYGIAEVRKEELANLVHKGFPPEIANLFAL